MIRFDHRFNRLNRFFGNRLRALFTIHPIKPEMLLGEDDCGHGVHQSHFRESDLKCFEKEALDLVLD